MLKRFALILALVMVLSCGCSTNNEQELESRIEKLESQLSLLVQEEDNYQETINALQVKVEELHEENLKLKDMMTYRKDQYENVLKTQKLGDQFVESYIQKDIEGMKSVVSDRFTITPEFIVYDCDDEEIKLNIVGKDMKYQLNSFGYENGNMFYQYMVSEDPPMGVMNGFFINLEVRIINGYWIIDGIEFDI